MTGHLKESRVTAIVVPNGMVGPSQLREIGSKLMGVEIFRNGVSERLEVLGSGQPSRFVSPYTVWDDVGVSGLDILTDTADVWAFDLYLMLVWDNTGTDMFGSPLRGVGGAVQPSSGLTGSLDARMIFNSAVTPIGPRRVRRMSLSFSDYAPAGASVLALRNDGAWVATESPTSISLVNGVFTVKFDWGREIPYIEFTDTTKTGTPSGMPGVMRYFPAATGDFDSMYLGPSLTAEYGLWNPSSSMVFNNRSRSSGGSSPAWWDTQYFASSYIAPGFPASITVVP